MELVAAQSIERSFGPVGDPGIPTDLSKLYQRYGTTVYQAAYRLLQSPEDAEDVLQDVFVKLPDVLHTFAGRGSFEGWIRQIAVRIALMKLRLRKRRAEVPFEIAASAVHDGSAATSLADRLTLEQAIAALPPKLRAVYVLKDVEGYSHDDIARMLELTPRASEVRLHRARKLLRKRLERSR